MWSHLLLQLDWGDYGIGNPFVVEVMALLRRSISSVILRQVKRGAYPCYDIHPLVLTGLVHSCAEPDNVTIVKAICNSLRSGFSWNILSRDFISIEINDVVVENVLLELKDPMDAKRALSFFHWSAQMKNYAHQVQTYCLMINILVQARLLIDAQALLESILKKSAESSSRFAVVDSMLSGYNATFSSPLVFDLLVQAYAKLRKVELGFDICCYLEERGFSLSLVTMNSLIHVAQKSDESALSWKIYEHLFERRIFPNEATIKAMMSGLCKEGKLRMFVDLLDKIHWKRCSASMIVNSHLILRILDEGRIEVGLVLLKRMLQRNLIIDTVAYSYVVYAKAKLGDLRSAFEVYEEMIKRGFEANSFVYTSLIGAYCEKGKVEEADQLLQEMQNMGLKPYGDTFNFLVEGFAKAGEIGKSLNSCAKMMEDGFCPSLSAFNKMAGELHEIMDVKQANELLTLALDRGFLPDEKTYSLLIAGFCKNGDLQEALKLYYEMEYRSLCPGLSAFSSLIKCMCRYGRLQEAEKFFEIMKTRSIDPSEDLHEALINARLEKGDKSTGLRLYREIVS